MRYRIWGLTAALVAATLLVPASGIAAPGDVRRASAAPGGVSAQGSSTNAALSADGRFVVFDSDASNIVAPDTNFSPDVFVYDRTAGTVARVSVSSTGQEADAGSESNTSSAAPMSSDGRSVAFSSIASNLVPGDDNDVRDVFVRDRTLGTTTRVSVATGGGQADGTSTEPSISAGGRYVVFASTATSLVPGDSNGAGDIFIHDRSAGTTERVSVATGGAEADRASFLPSVSDDGRFVVWYSLALNLVPDDFNAAPDVFLRDRVTGTTTRLSVSPAGVEGDAGSFNPVISAAGDLVVFRSASSNLVSGDTNGVGDVFVRDLPAATTTRISVSATGAEADAAALPPSISADGRFVAFASPATNLIPGDTNDAADVFVCDLVSGALRRVSVTASAQAGGHSLGGSVSDGGGFVAFDSLAADLVSGDSNDDWDAFLVEPDVTAPGLPVIGTPGEGSRPTTAAVTVSGSAEPRATVMLLDGGAQAGAATADGTGAWSSTLTFAEGPHTLTARASDLSGNIGPATAKRSFVVDLGPPAAPVIVAPAQGAAIGSTLVTIGGTAEPATTVAVTEGAATLGTAATSSAGNWTLTVSLTEGSHSIRARATDAADNLSPYTSVRGFTVDLTPPPAPVISAPPAGGLAGAGAVVVAGSAEPGAVVTVLEGTVVLGSAVTGGGGGWTLTASITSRGPHTVFARARDAAANTGPPSAPRSFTVTTPAPVIVLPSEGRFLASSSVTISGTAEPGSTVEVRRDGGTLVGTATATEGTWSLPAGFAEGAHMLEAVATGADGWVGVPSPLRTFIVDLTPPAPPAINAPAEASTVSSVVAFFGSAEAGSTVYVMESGTAIALGVAGSSGTWTTTATLSPGTHSVTAVSEDRAGNRSPASAVRTFTVAAVVQIVTPGQGSFQPPSASVSGTAPASASLVRVYDDGVEIGSATPHGGVWSVTLPFERGVHTLTGRALVSGMLGTPSATRSFTADTKPPNLVLAKPAGYVLFGVLLPAGAVHGTAEEIDQYDSGVVSVRVQYYDLAGALVAQSDNACAGCPGHDVTWTDRPNLPAGFYRVRVTAVDAVGNRSPPASMEIFAL